METCKVYENWVQQRNDNRLDIITYSHALGFECLALDAIFDKETAIPLNDELEQRLQGRRIGCSYLVSLTAAR